MAGDGCARRPATVGPATNDQQRVTFSPTREAPASTPPAKPTPLATNDHRSVTFSPGQRDITPETHSPGDKRPAERHLLAKRRRRQVDPAGQPVPWRQTTTGASPSRQANETSRPKPTPLATNDHQSATFSPGERDITPETHSLGDKRPVERHLLANRRGRHAPRRRRPAPWRQTTSGASRFSPTEPRWDEAVSPPPAVGTAGTCRRDPSGDHRPRIPFPPRRRVPPRPGPVRVAATRRRRRPGHRCRR